MRQTGTCRGFEFGPALRVLRAARGMSQMETASAARIDAKFISHIETGKMLPSEAWEQRLRAALGWTPEVDAALDALAEALAAGREEAA